MDKIEARRREIIKLLEQVPMITVSEMANNLNVTTETIRKDLGELEKQGLVVKIRGGAALVERSRSVPYDLREVINKDEKRSIAKSAIAYIPPESTLLIEGSTTTMALCHELLEMPELLQTLTVLTNSLYIAELFDFGKLCKGLFVMGGWVQPAERVTQWAFTAKALEHFQVDWSILSAAALNRKFQVTTYYERDMLFQQAAVQAAGRTMLLLDKSKYGTSAIYRVFDLEEINLLISDIPFRPDELRALDGRKVEVVCVE